MKVAINKCYGGFDLSDEAFERLIELGMTACKEGEEGFGDADIGIFGDTENTCILGKYFFSKFSRYDPELRANPLLIQVIEELGDKASGSYSKLSIVEIPDDVEFTIEEYDGFEHVAEVHRTWG